MFLVPAFPLESGKCFCFYFYRSALYSRQKLWLTVNAKERGFLCVPGVLGSSQREVFGVPHCHHHTPHSSWDVWPVLDVGCLVVKRWQTAGTLLESQAVFPCGWGPEPASEAHHAGMFTLQFIYLKKLSAYQVLRVGFIYCSKDIISGKATADFITTILFCCPLINRL